jgi:hypothetical protein
VINGQRGHDAERFQAFVVFDKRLEIGQANADVIDACGIRDLVDGILVGEDNDTMVVVVKGHESAETHVVLYLGIEKVSVPFDHRGEVLRPQTIV